MKGHIRSRGKGTWGLVVDIGRDAAGRRRRKWHSFKGTKREAQRELTKILESLRTGTYVEPQRITVSELLEKWLEFCRSKVGAKTHSVYEEICRLHLTPALGNLRIAKLQAFHLDEYYQKALREGRRQRAGGLAPATVHKHHRVMREALQRAVRWNWVSRNAADFAEPPMPEKKEMKALDQSGISALLAAAEGSRLYIPILLAVTTGMRRGEILALRWQDIDGDRLTVRRAVEQTKGGISFKLPKTDKSMRTIALPAFVARAVRRHKAEQAQEKLLIGPKYRDEDLIVCTPIGTVWSPGALTVAFRRLARDAKIGCRFHDLRHSHATHLLSLGIHPKIVSERLGHSRVGFTLDVYSHVLEGMQEEAAAKIDAALGQNVKG